MSLYHGYKFSDRAFGNLLSSLVVFDEVHAYDSTTLNAIREGQKVLNRYQIPTLFMSATLPTTRRTFFGFTEPQTIIESDNPFVPFRAEQLTGPLTTGKGFRLEATPVARQAIRDSKNLKLAIYVNQIERAKALKRAAKEELKDTPVFCYHSELAPKDRRELEEKVLQAFKCDQPMVLIATQAAELSLNISAERMITELAPADTLVQRAGRLHRRGLTPTLLEATKRLPKDFEFRLLIAPLDLTPDKNKPEIVYGALPYNNVSLLERTWSEAPWKEDFSFEKGLLWCEDALTDEVPNLMCGVEKAHLNDTVFGRRPQENFNGEDNTDGVVIRDIDSKIVLVVPQSYYDADLPDTRQKLAQFQVAVRQSRFRALPKTAVFETTIPLTNKKSWREEVEVSFPIIVVRHAINYDPEGGGFDFWSLPENADEVYDDGNKI
jgi:CRISPR-associated endonuclease/helicase Cas3